MGGPIFLDFLLPFKWLEQEVSGIFHDFVPIFFKMLPWPPPMLDLSISLCYLLMKVLNMLPIFIEHCLPLSIIAWKFSIV